MSDRTPADHELYEELVQRDAVHCDHEHDAAIDPDGEWITVEVHPQVIYDALVARQERAAGYRVVPIPDDNTRAEVARIVATHWRDHMAKANSDLRLCAHPLAMVLAALDGETDPAQLGIDPDGAAAAYLDGQPQDRPDTEHRVAVEGVDPPCMCERCPGFDGRGTTDE